MEEFPHHLGCIKPCKYWDKLPTSTGDRRISEPSTGYLDTLIFFKVGIWRLSIHPPVENMNGIGIHEFGSRFVRSLGEVALHPTSAKIKRKHAYICRFSTGIFYYLNRPPIIMVTPWLKWDVSPIWVSFHFHWAMIMGGRVFLGIILSR